jgi:hypothetical protein
MFPLSLLNPPGRAYGELEQVQGGDVRCQRL